MHPNPAFRGEPRDRNLAFARERGFGVLSINADPAPLISHVPFVIDAAGAQAELHLVRSNPIARAVPAPTPAVIAVTGPDGYVSPDWYGDPAQVPTWNYVAVHLRGQICPAPPETLRAHLDRLSESFETRLAPKAPWKAEKMPKDALERMMRMILPFRFEVAEVTGTWKLNQNKTDEMREAAASHMNMSPVGQETALLSALMLAISDPE
ncbi:FMN-binding negative transcriptional regulator [Fontisubflavum oceani]|uniref:FMN-binding negative transcriptional regulator n=1 Tax=Fontisubflavum oceani TaxID=2978973 RepID=UPI0025B465CD|nr:FMN-binding negative transcriptional regulator [Fontisubflavum oceani]WJY22665.1 FMN-binding negative transcriptional regulator [Fontisubflavum oceani]